MIVRIWTTHVADGREVEYLAFAQDRSRLMFLSQPGCLGVLFLKALDGKHAACSFWKSSADIESLASSSSYNDTASELAATGVLLGKQLLQFTMLREVDLTAQPWQLYLKSLVS